MSLKNNRIDTIIFFVFFVIQFIVSNTIVAMNLNKVYWIVYFGLIVFIAGRCGIQDSAFNKERLFLYICSIGAIFTLFVGEKYGLVILKILTMFTGYVGYVYLSKHRIDLRFFYIVFILLYAYFVYVYFSRKTFLVDVENEYSLFGHSSSNLIPMALNGVLFFYYFIDRNQGSEHLHQILFFSVINLYLIIIQSSRMGVFVSAILVLLVLFDNYKKTPKHRWLFSLIFVAIILVCVSNLDFLNKYIQIVFLESSDYSNYEADCRTLARLAFFEQMTPMSALFGNRSGTLYADLGRTFNSFLDFWSNYGILSFFTLLVLSIKRIVNRSEYSIPVYMLIPILAYSNIETLWGMSMWDILLFISLFYSKK